MNPDRGNDQGLITGERRRDMDNVLLTRIVAGVLLVIVLGILVQRRRIRIR